MFRAHNTGARQGIAEPPRLHPGGPANHKEVRLPMAASKGIRRARRRASARGAKGAPERDVLVIPVETRTGPAGVRIHGLDAIEDHAQESESWLDTRLHAAREELQEAIDQLVTEAVRGGADGGLEAMFAFRIESAARAVGELQAYARGVADTKARIVALGIAAAKRSA